MTRDLTKGNPAKLILLFTIPYLIGNIFQQFYNIADTVIVGRTIGINALAAVGATGSLCWFAIGFVQGFTTGFSVITAQFFGSGNIKGVKKSFALSILLTFLLTFILTVACCALCRNILQLVNTPREIIDDSYRYLITIYAGLFATAMFNLFSNMIRSLGNSRVPLIFLIVACIVNISLDFVLILHFNMGIAGAAVATVLAQLVSAVCCIIYIARRIPELHITTSDFKWDKVLVSNLLSVGLPMAFLCMIISLGGITIQWVTNSLGTQFVASYTAANKLDMINNQPVQSFGMSIAVYVAQNYGKRDIERIKAGVNKCLLMTYIWTAFSVFLMIFFGKDLVTAVVGSAESIIIDNARKYLIISSSMMVLLAPLVIYKSTLQALGKSLIPVLSGVAEVFCRAFVAVIFARNYGFIGLCFANPSAWFGALVLLAIEYFRHIKKLTVQSNEAISAELNVQQI